MEKRIWPLKKCFPLLSCPLENSSDQPQLFLQNTSKDSELDKVGIELNPADDTGQFTYQM